MIIVQQFWSFFIIVIQQYGLNTLLLLTTILTVFLSKNIANTPIILVIEVVKGDG